MSQRRVRGSCRTRDTEPQSPGGTLHSLRPGCAECHRWESPPAGLSTEPLQLLEGTSLKGDSGGKDQPSDTQWLPLWAETQRKKKEVQEEA